MLRVTPIYGSSLSSAYDDDPKEWLSNPAPCCTLVEYAGMRLLLDAGWDETLPLKSILADGRVGGEEQGDRNGRKVPHVIPAELPEVDAILITNSTLASLGGLPVYFQASKEEKRGRVARSLFKSDHDSSSGNCQGIKKHNPPFLATYPTVKMGQMTLYDHHASLSLDGTSPGYSLEDVDAVFGKDSFITLKYSQAFYLPLDDNEDDHATGVRMDTFQNQPQHKASKILSITPQLSGHVVGGCYYVLKQLSDDTEVILAPTYHHAKEKHLAGSTLHKFGLNADALLTMPGGARGLLGNLYHPPPPASKSGNSIIHYNKEKPILSPPLGSRIEAELIDFIMASLRRDGNVLLPVDASGRVLELLLILDRLWERERLGDAYNLCWVGSMASNTIEFARSQLEWMSEPLGAQFDSQRGHPYALKSVRICSSVAEVEGVIEASNGNPTAVLASGASLDHGPARDLLLKWGDNPDNLVLITDSSRCVPRGDVWFSRHGLEGQNHPQKEEKSAVSASEEGETDEDSKLLGSALSPAEVSAYSTSSQLLYQWCTAKAVGEEMADVVAVDVLIPHRSPLSGNELKAFLAEEEAERLKVIEEREKKAMMQEIELARGRLRLGEEDTTLQPNGKGAVAGTTAPKSSSGKLAVTTHTRPNKKSRFDQNLFIKFSKPVHMTFDVREEAVGIGQPDSVAKYGIGESIGRFGEVLEDDYGIAVQADSFIDIVTGVDPSKFSGGSGKIGEEVTRRGLGFGVDGRPVIASGGARHGVAIEGLVNDGMDDELGANEKMLEVADLSNGKGIIKGRNGRPPIKVLTIPRKFEVLAEVAYISLEGRVDARAARQSVRALQPRHLIVIGGPKSSSLSLVDALRLTGSSNAYHNKHLLAFTPTDGETVQLTVGHAAYPVRLIDTPYLSPTEKENLELTGKEIEPVVAFEAKIGACSVSLVDFIATGKKWAVDGSIVLAPRFQKSKLNQPSLLLSTREVLLTDLRAEVIALGMKAEYGALSGYSQLTVNGKIIVRKDNITGKLNIEGPLCEDFYNVRSVVRGQFVTL